MFCVGVGGEALAADANFASSATISSPHRRAFASPIPSISRSCPTLAGRLIASSASSRLLRMR